MDKKDAELNKVILIGENHHNGLGLVRSFGAHGIRPYGIIVGENADKGFCRKSRYWKKTWVVKENKEILDILKEQFSAEKEKPVIIPYSDGVAEMLDLKLENLSKDFILPSFAEKAGAIQQLMNKQEQVKFAKKIGIEMLPSTIIDLCELKIQKEFPIILKPVLSVEGIKADIRICKKLSEYQQALVEFKHKGYQRILVQKYLENRKEYVLTGAITKKRISFDIVKHIRQWPKDMGSGSFSVLVSDERLLNFAQSILEILLKEGFCGPIDMEFFENAEGEFYLNEFNWRSSGRNFVSLYTGNHAAYLYYCDQIGIDAKKCKEIKRNGYTMNEGTDLRHVFQGLSFRKWLSDVRKTNCFALWSVRDPKPALIQYFHFIKAFFSGNRFGKF